MLSRLQFFQVALPSVDVPLETRFLVLRLHARGVRVVLSEMGGRSFLDSRVDSCTLCARSRQERRLWYELRVDRWAEEVRATERIALWEEE